MISRERGEVLIRRGRTVAFIAVAGLVLLYIRALGFTSIERFQGPAQKIFYVHVPAAVSALMAFSITGVVSIIYLALRDRRLDLFAASSAEVGVAFSITMLTTGPIWGKPIWGTWWTWDARLTSSLFIFLLFVGYLVMRGAVVDPQQRARYAAVIGILGLVLVPFIHLSVYLFRTLHPDPVVLKPGKPSLPGDMLLTLMMGFVVFFTLYAGFVMLRYGMALRDEAAAEEIAGGSS